MLVHSLNLALPIRMEYNISERGRGIGRVAARKFGIPSTICRKLIKLETSNLVYSFILIIPTRSKYNICERGRGLGHVTPIMFGIPSSISPEPVKPESSMLVYSLNLALPIRMEYNISERGRSLDHVTLEIWHTLNYISKTSKARDLKFGIQLLIDPPHKNEVPYF